jgi:hypothetical protein
VFSVVRQNVINALAAAATRAGAEIITGSAATGTTADGELTLIKILLRRPGGHEIAPDAHCSIVVGWDGSRPKRERLHVLLEQRGHFRES